MTELPAGFGVLGSFPVQVIMKVLYEAAETELACDF